MPSHAEQRNCQVYQRPPALSPYTHLVNVPVSPLDTHTSALVPTHRSHYPHSHPVIDGEVVTSIATPVRRRDRTKPRAILVIESKRSLLRRAIDDPYWILITLMTITGVSITATVIYGVIHIALAVSGWLATNGTTIAAITVLIILLATCGGATAAKCAGIHCGGCKG